ncbi:MAG: gas vesicle protein [Phycisphaerales bacterium]
MSTHQGVSKLRRASAASSRCHDAAERSHGGPVSLCDALDRVLSAGVCARGDLTISVAGVDLLYVGVSSIVASVEAAQRAMEPVCRTGDAG